MFWGLLTICTLYNWFAVQMVWKRNPAQKVINFLFLLHIVTLETTQHKQSFCIDEKMTISKSLKSRI